MQLSLSNLKKGEMAIIRRISTDNLPRKYNTYHTDVELNLLQMGFIEGATITVLHFGLIGRDPIAVRINNHSNSIAIRRSLASAILVEKIS